MNQGYGMAEIERRCRELGERERANGNGIDSTVRVRFVAPRPKPKRVPTPKPATPPRDMRPKEPRQKASPKPRTPRTPGVPTGRRGRVWTWLLANGPATTNRIAEDLGFDVPYTGVCLNKLTKRGLASRTGRKVWSSNSASHTEWQAHPFSRSDSSNERTPR